MSDSEGPSRPAMRMVSVTGLCASSAVRCEVGDVTMTISFTRPVGLEGLAPGRYYCPWCGKPLRSLKTTVVRDGVGRLVGASHVQ